MTASSRYGRPFLLALASFAPESVSLLASEPLGRFQIRTRAYIRATTGYGSIWCVRWPSDARRYRHLCSIGTAVLKFETRKKLGALLQAGRRCRRSARLSPIPSPPIACSHFENRGRTLEPNYFPMTVKWQIDFRQVCIRFHVSST